MRTRSLLVPSMLALAVLGGCTSDPEPETPSATDTDLATASASGTADATESTLGIPQPPAANGYLCSYVSPSVQRGVAGADLAEPLEVTTEDGLDVWSCEARDGEEAVVRVSISRGEEFSAQARDAARSAGVEMGGPAHLGEVYLDDRTVTALTMCRVPDAEGSLTYEPYALVVEAPQESATDVRRDLTTVATVLAGSLDQSVGCSPKMALENADGAAVTTAP